MGQNLSGRIVDGLKDRIGFWIQQSQKSRMPDPYKGMVSVGKYDRLKLIRAYSEVSPNLEKLSKVSKVIEFLVPETLDGDLFVSELLNALDYLFEPEEQEANFNTKEITSLISSVSTMITKMEKMSRSVPGGEAFNTSIEAYGSLLKLRKNLLEAKEISKNESYSNVIPETTINSVLKLNMLFEKYLRSDVEDRFQQLDASLLFLNDDEWDSDKAANSSIGKRVSFCIIHHLMGSLGVLSNGWGAATPHTIVDSKAEGRNINEKAHPYPEATREELLPDEE